MRLACRWHWKRSEFRCEDNDTCRVNDLLGGEGRRRRRGSGCWGDRECGCRRDEPDPSAISAEEELRANVRDISFDYDKANLRSDAQSVLPGDAAYLASHPSVKVLIGGYCDERGSNEYNLSLGQERAEQVKKALLSAGIAANRVRVISYGKEKPFCSEATDACWQQDRRAGLSLDQ